MGKSAFLGFEGNSRKLYQADIKKKLADRQDELIPEILLKDILASINYLNGLAYGIGTKDGIDHLGNRRLRCIGELLQNHFRIGFRGWSASSKAHDGSRTPIR